MLSVDTCPICNRARRHNQTLCKRCWLALPQKAKDAWWKVTLGKKPDQEVKEKARQALITAAKGQS